MWDSVDKRGTCRARQAYAWSVEDRRALRALSTAWARLFIGLGEVGRLKRGETGQVREEGLVYRAYIHDERVICEALTVCCEKAAYQGCR